jgi:hypothetical protein
MITKMSRSEVAAAVLALTALLAGLSRLLVDDSVNMARVAREALAGDAHAQSYRARVSAGGMTVSAVQSAHADSGQTTTE